MWIREGRSVKLGSSSFRGLIISLVVQGSTLLLVRKFPVAWSWVTHNRHWHGNMWVVALRSPHIVWHWRTVVIGTLRTLTRMGLVIVNRIVITGSWRFVVF